MMHLLEARLCLDCEELHTRDRCPRCASEAFAFVTQWIPASERQRARPALPHAPLHRRRWLTGTGVIGVAVFAAVRLWKERSSTHDGADVDPTAG